MGQYSNYSLTRKIIPPQLVCSSITTMWSHIELTLADNMNQGFIDMFVKKEPQSLKLPDHNAIPIHADIFPFFTLITICLRL